MDFHQVVLANIIGPALGIPLAEGLKWLLPKLITVVGESLALGWGYVRALLNETPGVETHTNANLNAIGTPNDVELGAVEMVPREADDTNQALTAVEAEAQVLLS